MKNDLFPIANNFKEDQKSRIAKTGAERQPGHQSGLEFCDISIGDIFKNIWDNPDAGIPLWSSEGVRSSGPGVDVRIRGFWRWDNIFLNRIFKICQLDYPDRKGPERVHHDYIIL